MNIYVGQFYIENNADYGFSYIFQKKMFEELTRLVKASPAFISKYGENFELMFRMSAKAALSENEVRGPTVFKRDKDVEYTIFLPFDHNAPMNDEKRKFALKNRV